MEKITLFSFATAGLSWILVKSKLFTPLREFFTLSYNNHVNYVASNGVSVFSWMKLYFYYFLNGIFNCEGCMGFWSGIVNYLLIYKTIELDILCYGFGGSIFSLLIIGVFNNMNRK